MYSENELYELMDHYQNKYYILNFDDALQKGIELTENEITFQIKK